MKKVVLIFTLLLILSCSSDNDSSQESFTCTNVLNSRIEGVVVRDINILIINNLQNSNQGYEISAVIENNNSETVTGLPAYIIEISGEQSTFTTGIFCSQIPANTTCEFVNSFFINEELLEFDDNPEILCFEFISN